MRLILLLTALPVLSSTSLVAQTPAAPATIVTAERLRAIGDSLTPGIARTAALGTGSGYTYALTHRDSSGGVELHMQWTDVFVVQSGHATMLTGGFTDGAKETTSGEWRGGVIQGGFRGGIKPGDVVVIPAGTPHQMMLGPAERISYLAFKVAVSTK
ncbi:MAG: hypothetical protein ABI969_09110 [bacterium]